MSGRACTELYKVWNFNYELKGCKFIIKGHSRGAERTGFIIPMFSLYLDCGVSACIDPKHMLLTHVHSDHSSALPGLLTRINTIPKIYCTKQAKPFINNFIQASKQLVSENFSEENEFEIIGLGGNDVVDIVEKNTKIRIKTYELDHSVSCNGYGLSVVRSRLKEEYRNLPGSEIANLRRSKIEISENYEYKFLGFYCDTSILPFNDKKMSKEMLSYQNIMVECTYLFEDDEEKSYTNKRKFYKRNTIFLK